jgi:hypothetical protein
VKVSSSDSERSGSSCRDEDEVVMIMACILPAKSCDSALRSQPERWRVQGPWSTDGYSAL